VTVGGTLKINRFMLETGLQHESEGVLEGSHAACWRFQIWGYFGAAGCAGASTGAAAAGACPLTPASNSSSEISFTSDD